MYTAYSTLSNFSERICSSCCASSVSSACSLVASSRIWCLDFLMLFTVLSRCVSVDFILLSPDGNSSLEPQTRCAGTQQYVCTQSLKALALQAAVDRSQKTGRRERTHQRHCRLPPADSLYNCLKESNLLVIALNQLCYGGSWFQTFEKWPWKFDVITITFSFYSFWRFITWERVAMCFLRDVDRNCCGLLAPHSVETYQSLSLPLICPSEQQRHTHCHQQELGKLHKSNCSPEYKHKTNGKENSWRTEESISDC